MSRWLLDRIAARGSHPAFIAEDGTVTSARFSALVDEWSGWIDRHGIGAGQVVVVSGDHSASDCALVLALALRRAVVAPVANLPKLALAARCRVAGAAAMIDTTGPTLTHFETDDAPPLVADLATRARAGLILFSSGSTGEPKACLLDLDALIETVAEERRGWATALFLMFDHIGGINTMLNILGHGGKAVLLRERTAEAVAEAIERHRVELLPTSPTFLKMLLISGTARDLSSLRMITYGTEPMPQATLDALAEALPEVRLKQTYGLSEAGIVPTRSRAPNSLWMQIGCEHRIVGGILHVRPKTAMLGYLNAPSPFDADGWLDTRDRVEVDGDWVRILGRDSELISIGGEKVHPGEVENILLAAPNVADATVTARTSPVTGNVLVASVALIEPEERAAMRTRLDRWCRERLEPFKVPAMFRLAEAPMHTARFKKDRNAA